MSNLDIKFLMSERDVQMNLRVPAALKKQLRSEHRAYCAAKKHRVSLSTFLIIKLMRPLEGK